MPEHKNFIIDTDSYKVSHHKQYPPGTTKVYSYLEARKGGEYTDVVFFGLQGLIKTSLVGTKVWTKTIREAEDLFRQHFVNRPIFNANGWWHILLKHGGALPLEIRAVPEGTIVPEGNVMMTVENTCPECYWLTNYIETILVRLWYPCTVTTISREMKKILKVGLERSGTDTPENLSFRLHDFGSRGTSSSESAAIGGAAHLVNFIGSDTVVALDYIRRHYNNSMAGFSIPAAEHSTISSWGESGEAAAYANMLDQFSDGMVAVVSDTWNLYAAIDHIWGRGLKAKVWDRKFPVVIRPDSGEPTEVLPKLLKKLEQAFGSTINDKGYKVLHPNVRVIQGDGIDRGTLQGIIDSVMDAGFSLDNMAFGCGGGLLQHLNRDTQRFALKCSYVEVNGEARNVYKHPATDVTKSSKKGQLALIKTEEGLVTVDKHFVDDGEDLLKLVFRNGELLVEQSLDEIRERAAI